MDKPVGITSRQVVTKISKILKIKKVGHGGTLDPLASGILPVAVGEATKVVSFIHNKKKKYSFVIKWGEKTDTDDMEGEVIKTSDIRPNRNNITRIISSFIGKIKQRPPLYSAIKINGKRSYNLARNKIEVYHKVREVNIYELALTKIINSDYAEFEVTCGKGTYVRSLARDIAEKLNTEGHVIRLRRTSVGIFREKDTIFIDFSKEILHSPTFLNNILPIETVLDDIPALVLNEKEAKQIQQGQKIQLNSLEFESQFEKKYPEYQKYEKSYAISNNKPIALIRIIDGIVKPARIINF